MAGQNGTITRTSARAKAEEAKRLAAEAAQALADAQAEEAALHALANAPAVATPTPAPAETPAVAEAVKAALSIEDMMAELQRLRGENANLKAQKAGSKSFLKVSAKGGVSVYGMARFPITLYVEQWEKVLAMSDEIKAFIKANESVLKRKGQATTATPDTDGPVDATGDDLDAALDS